MKTNINDIVSALIGEEVNVVPRPLRPKSGIYTAVQGVLLMVDGHYEVDGINCRYKSRERRRLVSITAVEIRASGMPHVYGEHECFIHGKFDTYVPEEC